MSDQPKNPEQNENHDYTQQQGIPSVAQNNVVTPNQKTQRNCCFLPF